MNLNDTEKDIILFNHIKEGNKLAFNTIFNKYYKSLCEFSFSIIGDQQLSEEITADVFTKIWIKKKHIKIKKKLKSYLYKSTYNTTISYIRKKKNNVINIEDTDNFQYSSYSDPENNLILQENMNNIYQLLLIIPERSRIIFKMHRINNLKYIEISEILGISYKTVEKHMGKAIKIMREYRQQMDKTNL